MQKIVIFHDLYRIFLFFPLILQKKHNNDFINDRIGKAVISFNNKKNNS